jgi:hypothetical protein
MELYFHSQVRLRGMVINSLSTRENLPFFFLPLHFWCCFTKICGGADKNSDWRKRSDVLGSSREILSNASSRHSIEVNTISVSLINSSSAA